MEASSIASFSTQRPPSVTLSVPTMPDAVEPSPYLILHELPGIFLKVLDFLASKRLCSPRAALVLESSSVDHNCRQRVSCHHIYGVTNKLTNLEIRTARVKVQIHYLRRRPNFDWANIKGVILSVCRFDRAWFSVFFDLAQEGLGFFFALGQEGVLQGCFCDVDDLKRSGRRRLEGILL